MAIVCRGHPGKIKKGENMDFKDLSYMLAIEKYGNISRAAESIFLTQPSLSRALQNVEQEIGQPLFKRLGNRYVPTYIGERYLSYARAILHSKQELDNEINDIIKSNIGILKIGFPIMRGTYMLPVTLPIFRSLYPKVKIDVKEANSDILYNMLMEGEIDLAFFNYGGGFSNLDFTVISHEEVLLVMGRGNELEQFGEEYEGGKYPRIDLKHLKDRDMIMQLPGQRTRNVVDKLFRSQGFEPKIVLEIANIHAAADLAARNYGICFITETHLKHINLENKLHCFSVGEPNTTVDFVAAFRKGSYVPYHAQEYIKIVKYFT